MNEFVSEAKYLDDLCFFRELLKLDFDNWCEDFKNGKLVKKKDAAETVQWIKDFDMAICYLHSKVKEYEDRSNNERVKRPTKISEYRIPERKVKWDFQSGRWYY